MGINERLKEERLRLGYTQEAFASLCGATKKSQINWEQGVAMPNAAVLAAYAAVGADVLYILTGQRSQGVAEVELLSPRQKALIDHYEALPEEGKKHIDGAAALLAKQIGKKKSA